MGIELHSVGSAPGLRLTQRIRQIPWSLVLLITMVASIGFAMLYSAAGGNAEPWMDRQMLRFAVGVGIMLTIAMVDLPRLAKIAYPLYAVALRAAGLCRVRRRDRHGRAALDRPQVLPAAALGADEDLAVPGAGALFPRPQLRGDRPAAGC